MSEAKGKPTQWHRLLGLMFGDFLADSPFEVDVEKDVSEKSQFLDVVIIRKKEGGTFDRRWPDGMEGNLRAHNLLSFKSYQDTLDEDTLIELLCHFWNYRRLVSPSKDDPLPHSDFSLFALSARNPRDLITLLGLNEVQEGVFASVWGTRTIRILVLNRLPLVEHNALLHLFSSSEDRIEYGQQHYHLRKPDISTRVRDLFGEYWEGLGVKYTMDDFARDFAREHIKDLPPVEVLKELRLKDVSLADLLKVLPAERVEELRRHFQGDTSPDHDSGKK